ncbi:MAG: porin family protein [Prevotella sp.]|nr:porin family protein [Prevotella sp.]
MRKALWLIVFIGMSLAARAQDEPEYRAEIGGGIGLVTYEGDFNGNLLKNAQPMGSLLARYRFNPRMALALSIGYGKLKGSSENVETWYPELNEQPVEFNNSLVDVSMRYEYNFWPFGTGREYRGAKPLTPYILIGLGGTFAKAGKTEMALNVPIGVGVKYKVADRLNMGLEWAIHFTGSDKLDGIADPYGIKSSGLFKNTDCYSQLRLSLSYDFWAKCKTCHSDRD